MATASVQDSAAVAGKTEHIGASDILALTTPLGRIYRIAMATGHLPKREELRPQPVGIQWPGAWQAFTKSREEKMMSNLFESCAFKTCLSTVGGNGGGRVSVDFSFTFCMDLF